MSLKCCIFDFDGTLFDSMFIWDQAGELYLRGLGKTPLPSTAEDLRTMSLRQAAQYGGIILFFIAGAGVGAACVGQLGQYTAVLACLPLLVALLLVRR